MPYCQSINIVKKVKVYVKEHYFQRAWVGAGGGVGFHHMEDISSQCTKGI
jgi:hypothetical protein